MKVSELVFYGRFRSDIHKITAEQALDLATDGDLPVFYKIDAPITLYGPAVTDPDGTTYPGADLGKWHSITVQVPRGILFDLISDETKELADQNGKPNLLRVDEVMNSDLPTLESYLLWPEGCPIRIERRKLFFRAGDLQGISLTQEKPLGTRERNSIAQIIAALAGMAKIDLEKPFIAYDAMRLSAELGGLKLPSKDTVGKWLKAADENCKG
tara:strand:- start:14261 stop:14899 length:639 start_codon:yes stop_codon:yes gene_type:complete